jgi:hypothetical protein
MGWVVAGYRDKKVVGVFAFFNCAESISNVWKIEELKKESLITLGLLLVYRFAQVTLQ